VYKNSTHIEVANVAGINGSPVELQATLTDQGNGNPIPGQTIDFTVNSVSVGSAVTDSSGVARLSYPIILAPGIYTVNATYAGNSVYNATHGTGLLTVYKNSTNILVINVEGINGQNVNLQATLTNQDGTPLNGKTIVFTINGTAIGSAITGTNGTATLNYPITVPPGTYTINTTFNGDGDYKTSNSTGILTVNKKIATMVVSNVNGTNGTVVDLNATLTDSDGNPFAGQTLYFRVDSNLVGSANTNGNGVASLAYLINPISGMHTIQIDFQGNADYQATTGYGNLRVPQSSLYIRTTASKTNPTLGETITITFKLGNNGPDTAENVIFTLVIPEGMEFINASTDQGSWTYNDTTRTITWNLGNVTVGDPNLWAIVRVLNNGNYVLMPFLSTDTYDPNLNSNIQPITISVQAASQEFEAVVNAGTVGMQNTGVPIGLLVMAVLMTLGGILVPKRKK
jgi:conserved repeat domain